MEKIEWKGGECPVSDWTTVNLWFRDGSQYLGQNAIDFSWLHGGEDGDIVHYEVIEEHNPRHGTLDGLKGEAKEDKPEKTLWDEYAIAWMSSGDWTGMTPEEAMGECVKVADAMMKARAK